MCVYGKRGKNDIRWSPVDQKLVQREQRADQQAGEAADCKNCCFPSKAARTLLAIDLNAVAATISSLVSFLKIPKKPALRSKCTPQREKNV